MSLHFLAKPLAFFTRDFKIAASYRLQFLLQTVGIFLTTFTFFLVGRMLDGQNLRFLEPYGGDFFSFVLIGIALTDYLTISTNTFAMEIRKAQMVGTLEALLTTPTSITTILLCSYCYSLLTTTLRIVLYLLLGTLLFHSQMYVSDPLAVALAFFLTLLPFFGLGLVSGAFILIFKQGSPISALLAMSSGLLGGVIYPVAVLPSWLKPVSSLLPITHGLEAMRQALLNGATTNDIKGQLFILLLFTLVLLTVGYLAIRYGLKVARKDGSLLHY